MAQFGYSVLIGVMSLGVLIGCETQQELGSSIDEGGFGTPTLNNVGVHNGDIQIRIDLAHRFANEVDSTVTFPFNSARLTPQAQRVLNVQADWIKQFPEVTFRVFGHTDAVGSDRYNQRLGKRRANAVVAYLSRRGVSRARLEAVVSFGETQPIIPTQDREQRNRRTVTEVSGFLSDDPILLNGKYASLIAGQYTGGSGAQAGGGSSFGSALGMVAPSQ